MTGAVQTFNRLFTGGFDLLFLPLSPLDPFLSLTVFSVLTGLLMVWIFGRVSNQKKIRRIKDRIQANLIAVRLFQNSITVFFRIQGRIFLNTLTYMGLSLKPMIVMIVPVLLILIQLHGRYAARPLEVGEIAVVTVEVAGPELLSRPGGVRLEAGEGIVVEAGPVRIPSRREVVWRVRATEDGEHALEVLAGDDRIVKGIVTGKAAGFISERRTGAGLLDMLLHPGEAPLDPSAPVTSVSIGYPQGEITFLGWNIHWLIWFFVLSIVSGYLLKGLLGVEL
jgi:uncharacterized membrane protein (DUF106 family)